MESIRDDTIGGFNASLNEQKHQSSKATTRNRSFQATAEAAYAEGPMANLSMFTAWAGSDVPGRSQGVTWCGMAWPLGKMRVI